MSDKVSDMHFSACVWHTFSKPCGPCPMVCWHT